MSLCNSSWWKDKAENGVHTGESKNFDGPQSHSDLGDILWSGEKRDHMGTDTGNIQTSTQTWLQVWDQTNYTGRTANISPNMDINMEDLYDTNGTGNMDDAIMSFKQFDTKPDFNTSQVVQYFRMQYTDGDSNADSVTYYTQDAQYEIDNPVITLQDGQYKIVIKMKHLQEGNPDQATITLYMDALGNAVNSISVDYTMGDAKVIPDWEIKLIDKVIDEAAKAATAILDSAEEVTTEGVATPALISEDDMINDTAKALTFVVDHMNAILAVVYKLQDNGGTMYFAAAVSHAIARGITSFYQELLGADPATPLSFSDQAFFDSLGLSNHWDTDLLKDSPFRDVVLSDYSYRFYQPENSFLYAHGGAVCSLKLDSVNDGHPDDHMILQMSFDPQGRLFSVVGSYDIYSFWYPDGFEPMSSYVLTFDSNHHIIRIHPDGTTEQVSGSSLAGAFKSVMLDVIAWYEDPAHYAMVVTDQQKSMLDLAVDIIVAADDAIN